MLDLFNVGFVGAAGAGSGEWDYDDDFSTDKGWITAATGNQIDTANSQLDFQLTRTNVFQGLYIATNDADVFGANFSDTAYIIRFHALNYSSINTSYSYNPFLTAQKNGGYDSESSSDEALSSWCMPTPTYTDRFGSMTNENGTRTNDTPAHSWSAGVDYYIENIRNSATEMRSTRSSSDLFNADQADITLPVPSTINDLKNITIMCDYAGSASTRTNIGTIDRIQAMKNVNTAP